MTWRRIYGGRDLVVSGPWRLDGWHLAVSSQRRNKRERNAYDMAVYRGGTIRSGWELGVGLSSLAAPFSVDDLAFADSVVGA
jgi:hypothetical protein